MLKELIHEKINEVFLAYQEANNVTSGDINPWDAFTLERIEDSLEALIRKVVAYQPKEMPASFYVYRDGNGIARSVTYKHTDTNLFFHDISHRIAFDDCSNEEIVEIFWHGKEVFYAGWQPCMKYEYRDLDGNTVWVGQFENWDH